MPQQPPLLLWSLQNVNSSSVCFTIILAASSQVCGTFLLQDYKKGWWVVPQTETGTRREEQVWAKPRTSSVCTEWVWGFGRTSPATFLCCNPDLRQQRLWRVQNQLCSSAMPRSYLPSGGWIHRAHPWGLCLCLESRGTLDLHQGVRDLKVEFTGRSMSSGAVNTSW